MRTSLLLAVTLAGTLAPTLSAQRNRRPVPPRERPATTSGDDYHFTPALHAGQRLSVRNIDGDVVVTQGREGAADIVVHKTVRRGNGDLVKAVLEETSDGYRVCTVYLDRAGDSESCDGRHNNRDGDREPLDVAMQYEIRLPPGVALSANTVDGSVHATGIDTPAMIRTVDGDVTFEGVAPEGLNTVDGAITATITNARWDHDLTVRTVDGNVDLTLPAGIGLTITGTTVDGEVNADFPVTLQGKWGPRSFTATMGGGGSRELQVKTVDGSIRLHQRGRE